METINYDPLNNDQFEAFQSIPEKEKTHSRIWGYIALLSIVAVAGYLIGKSRREIKLRNPIVFKNKGNEDSKSGSSPLFK